MATKKIPLITNEVYHIYNRGVDKRDIFIDKSDVYRFIETVKEFNRMDRINSLSNFKKLKKQISSSQIGLGGLSGDDKLVEILAYCFNPNHFHLVLRQNIEGGISKFMQKIQSGYTNYFNIKNSRSGALFQGKFKYHIVNNEYYFNKIIGYVNKNYLIHNIPENKNQLVFSGDHEYENNKFNLISTEEAKIILDVFGGVKKFKDHCDEIVSIIREERGIRSLLEDENIQIGLGVLSGE